MFTPLRRFEVGKMLLNLVPVIVATGIASRFFTKLPLTARLGLFVAIVALVGLGILVLPDSMNVPNETKRK